MSDFMIDGVDMPAPSSWQTNVVPNSSDPERAVATGELFADYVNYTLETIWTYKYLSQSDYDTLYNAYTLSTIRNRNLFHTLTTRDSNTDSVITYTMYLQSDFKAPLYRIKIDEETGERTRYYKDVSFTFISKSKPSEYNAIFGGDLSDS